MILLIRLALLSCILAFIPILFAISINCFLDKNLISSGLSHLFFITFLGGLHGCVCLYFILSMSVCFDILVFTETPRGNVMSNNCFLVFRVRELGEIQRFLIFTFPDLQGGDILSLIYYK